VLWREGQSDGLDVVRKRNSKKNRGEKIKITEKSRLLAENFGSKGRQEEKFWGKKSV